jgi:hypothetical protein
VDEASLVEQLKRVETEYLTADDVGSAAACRGKLAEWRQREPGVEHRISIRAGLPMVVFGGVCLRFGVVPYQRSRRSASTVYVEVPRGFLKEVLLPLSEAMITRVERSLGETVRRAMEEWAGDSFEAIEVEKVEPE